MSERVQIVGPFEHHAVVIDGRRVPRLTATPSNGGRISLCLDDRIGCDVQVADAEWLIPFIADCIAVGMGYTGFPESGADPIPRPDLPIMVELGDMP